MLVLVQRDALGSRGHKLKTNVSEDLKAELHRTATVLYQACIPVATDDPVPPAPAEAEVECEYELA